MSKKEEKKRIDYSYVGMSNLVLQADRSLIPKREKDFSGEVSSLWGKLNPKEFGSQAKSREVVQKPKISAQKKKSVEKYGHSSILSATQDFVGNVYAPQSKETKLAFEMLLAVVEKILGDIPSDVVRSAVDGTLEILKQDTIKDSEKKHSLEELLSTQLKDEEFSNLLALSKQITDYHSATEDTDKGPDELGVAVLFDEDEESEDMDQVQDIQDVQDAQDSLEEEERQQTLKSMNSKEVDQELDDGQDDFTTVLKVESENKKEEVKLIPSSIDAFWMQRTIGKLYDDAHLAQSKANACLELLDSSKDLRQIENELMDLFDYTHFDLVKLFTRNRTMISWCTKMARSKNDQEKQQVIKQMKELGLDDILMDLDLIPKKQVDGMEVDITLPNKEAVDVTALQPPKQNLDLEELAFEQGGHLMSNKKVKLPQGSFKKTKKGYEEIHVPAPKPRIDEKEVLVPINALPSWAQKAFKNATKLNRVQSKVFQMAFNEDDNMLLCAPTGAGKTNCAMLTILREVGKHIDPQTNVVDLESFKIIYIAPMKALVAEMVGNFGSRLADYRIKVSELTGDRQMTKEQIAETQIIITTPEKWDVITRKAHDRSYTRLVSLIIIDEIHLLHDDRGPVLESVISRTIRQVQSTQKLVRLVGLSATLPNYQDVATFLRVDPERGLFFFDNSYRPCPLKQQYIGITEKKAIKRNNMMNEITYEKIMEEAGKNQVLVFCHSRKDTAKTAKAIRDMAIEKETITQILRMDASSREILQAEAEGVKNSDLQDLLPYGFAIHHAGMTRVDRTLVEDLFADGHIQVLVSTATLAWGVNLPAHTVIIKGTQVYSPEKGRWMELSPQDVLQMLGRAGRPQFDTHGEGIIITTNSEMQFYLSLLNVQLPIESQFIAKLADHMNAEIVLGTIRTRQDAVDWLGYTYLYVRMLRNGSLYGVTVEDAEEDPYLIQKRIDIVHAAATVLDRCSLIKYDKKTGKFQGTELGRIASHYYISHKSMATYNQHLKASMSQIDLFRVFALSDEFKFIPVREEEKIEIAKMIERVPIPVKESVDEPTAKINILLQAYISQLKLEGFALIADMVYVTQSAGRILRAIFEMCLKRGWAQSSYKALDLCKMVDKNMWLSLNPLRQIKGFPMDVIKKLERKEFPWDRYFDLSAQELGELANMAKSGPMIHKYVHQFPRLQLQAHVQPITRSLLRIELTITPDFEFDEQISANTESFWVIVEDSDSEMILYHETFQLKRKYAKEDHYLTFTVQMFEPLPPNYFVTVVSDRWLHCTARLPISFKHLILPEKYPPHTELLDLQPLPVSGLGQKEFEKIYRDKIDFFNPIHTQTFHTLYNSDENTFIGASYGSDITVCAEFALMRLWMKNVKARAVYVAPFDVVAERRKIEWEDKFANCLGGKNLVVLTGETAADLKLLEAGDIIFTTAEKWDILSRRWKQRKNVQTVGLFIIEDIHLLGGEIGPTLEVVVSRMRYISAQTENNIRIVAMGVSLANSRDIGEWIGASNQSIYNFSPSVKPVPLEIHIQGFNVPHFASLMLAMGKPLYNSISTLAADKSVVVFVPNRKQCRLVAVDLLSYCFADGEEKKLLKAAEEDIRQYIDQIEDTALSQTLELGVAFYHEALSANDKNIVESLFKNDLIQVMIVSRDCCWGLSIKSYMVIVMGAQYYEGKEHRYVDYPVTEVLCMMGVACKASIGETSRCVLMCQSYKKDFYKKFLYEALPVESHLDHYLHDHFNAEIVTKTIENKQDAVDYLTWTFLYRRMALNPNYYNLAGVSYQHLSDHLSELVEQTLEDLANSKCITIEEDDVSPLNLGMIAAYYYINYVTIEAFSLSLRPKTKLRGLLEIISSAAEFDEVPIRHHEDGLLRKIYDRVPVKIENSNFNDPHLKTAILLQAHFSRLTLPADLESDQKLILGKIIRLLQACVDVVSSNGWLPPALSAMELCQMSVQALWDRDSPLMQIPHLSGETIKALNQEGVEGIFDLMELDDEKRISILSLDKARLSDVARFVNQYPNIDVQFEIDSENVEAGDVVTVVISLEREGEEDEAAGPVIAPFYPFKKDEGWWLVIGNPADKSLLAIKRTSFGVKTTTKLEFNAPSTVGPVVCKMYLMSDSYLGVDQEFDLSLNISEAQEGSEEENEDAMDQD